MENINKIQIVPDEVYEIGADKAPVIPEWSVKDDSTLYEKVRKLAHSTFDRSKFTKVGSPTITSDGIASGFSTSNRVYFTQTTFAKNTLTIKHKAIINNLTAEGFQYYIRNSVNSEEFYLVIAPGYVQVRGSHSLAMGNGGLSFVNGDIVETEVTIGLNSQSIKIWKNGTLLTPQSATKTFNSLDFNNYYIGSYSNGAYNTTCLLDLKQFSITVDGVEVFSGNRTGIDTIKPDDFAYYTKMFAYSDGNSHTIYADDNTTPTKLYNADGSKYTGSDFTISEGVVYYGETACSYVTSGASDVELSTACDAGVKVTNDGIASGFSTNAHILIPLTFTVSDALEMQFEFTTADVDTGQTIFGLDSNQYNRANIVDVNGTKRMQYTTIDNGVKSTRDFTILPNTTYYFIIGRKADATNWYFNVYNNGFGPDKYMNEAVPIVNGISNTAYLHLGATSNNAAPFKGSINLNNIRFYINGELKQQPCLKIPYTEGKGNKKVVDVAYRPRVQDLFEQEGYNIYYTLGEDDFTLPSNKPDEIVKYKANGLTVAEQRADQTLTIRGACEQGVDVNLPMEFFSADSYAVFGVGTTGTNTASKFTPAADGNYIAIGKGKV